MKLSLTSLLFGDPNRRRYRDMLQMDDRLLADAGISRAELHRLIKAPRGAARA